MVDIFEKPELRLARLSPRPNCASGVRCPFRQSCGSAVRGPFRCAQEDYLNIYEPCHAIRLMTFYDPCNVIRFIMSFLSRSTQESGFQTKKKKKRPERKAIK